MPTSFEAGISLLQDTVCNFYTPTANGGDSGVIATWGSPVQIYIDKATIKANIPTADHSAGQNPYPINRATKYDMQADIEFKLLVTAEQLLLLAGTQIKIIGVSTIDVNTRYFRVIGIITDQEEEHSGPSTYKITIKPYAILGGAANGANPGGTQPFTVSSSPLT